MPLSGWTVYFSGGGVDVGAIAPFGAVVDKVSCGAATHIGGQHPHVALMVHRVDAHRVDGALVPPCHERMLHDELLYYITPSQQHHPVVVFVPLLLGIADSHTDPSSGTFAHRFHHQPPLTHPKGDEGLALVL